MRVSIASPKATMSLKILIVGAGVCGPALALLLQKSNPKHSITVIERYPSLRTGGQQIDLKAQGIPIVKKMGLLEAIRSHLVAETGMELVDTNGKRLMHFGVQGADQGGRSLALTNEYEFMRGDMVKIFYDATIAERAEAERNGEKEGGLKYEFGTTVTALDQSSDNGVAVTLSNGQTAQYDLVVAADGQGSRTRRLAFGEEVSTEAFKGLGVHAAYFNIPRLSTEDNLARIHFAPDSRMVMTRTGNRPITQVYFFLMKDKERNETMKKMYKESQEKQKEIWTEVYEDAGWECERFVKGMKTAEDFYACEIAQVKMPRLHTGRVVLLGDAGYCPSPFTGELARNKNDVSAALTAYDKLMRQPITEYQKLGPGTEGGFYPSSALGIRIVNNILWTLSCFRVDKAIQWIHGMFPAEQGKWLLPEYPELNLGSENAK
ncbi:FAD/NAD(P)-binding domain-containing protein [Cucurbitaria berberidis CBS 394.84]|uniref:FAD/NAD(P)-binding domain-containing protein n=1 Tax=Cucurbitaria berberidis CBS 394.84 TaxID=1168544 RepID=A0A9P4G8G1_9PLEO|nr:FAD/NAD(P)-binding domain-containing protein [Cucurbitaria berberidis CBS 394.84]KAF1841008.1 FAD/NAD(P)-binding domain-containing protein [Cucurbitaria berberidis CBS 394.84]